MPNKNNVKNNNNQEKSSCTDTNKWCHATVKSLLNARLKRESDFNRPKCKKKSLWNFIALDVSDESQIQLTAEECDLKYRNLLKTYKVNKTKQNTSGSETIKWEYFEDFDTILGCKASITPPDETIHDSLNIETSESVTDQEDEENTSDNAQIKSKKRKFTLSDYLQQKLQYDEEKEKRRQEIEQERWQQSIDLRKQEIDAILKLVEVLKKD